MEGSVKISGLNDALKVLEVAFPKAPKKQRSILLSGMRSAAKKTIVPESKALARHGDSSGSLSESIGIRSVSAKKTLARGVAAGVEVLPVRSSRSAMAMYIEHYYTSKGLVPPASVIVSGIRHGHLIEFGSKNNPANSFLWAAGVSQGSSYAAIFAVDLKKKIEADVRRSRKK